MIEKYPPSRSERYAPGPETGEIESPGRERIAGRKCITAVWPTTHLPMNSEEK